MKTTRLFAHGFTLVEMLIALSVLSLLLGMLYSGLYTLSQGAQGSSAGVQSLNKNRIVHQFIRTQLSQVRPVSRRDGNQLSVLFRGKTDGLVYAGQLPFHRGGGGLQYIELGLNPARNILMLHYTTAQNDISMERGQNMQPWQQHTLLEGVSALRFSYYGQKSATSTARWFQDWSEEERLPKLIKIETASATAEQWPALVVSVPQLTADNQPRLVWQ